jgi:hypothetical protein
MERGYAPSSQDRWSVFFKATGLPTQADLIPGTLKKPPRTILAGHGEHILTCVPMSQRFELAAGGAQRRVFAAWYRRVPFN